MSQIKAQYLPIKVTCYVIILVILNCLIIASPNLMSAQITSLDAHGDILYTGLENGLILCLKCGPDMHVSIQFGAYNRAVSSLMVLKPPQQSHGLQQPEAPLRTEKKNPYYTERQKKRKDSPHSPMSSRTRSLRIPQRNKRQQSLDITPGSFRVTSSYQTAENLLLMSLGKAFTGITGPHENHPKEFILPRVSLQSNRKPAKAEASSSHLLIWSTEICDLVEGEESEDMMEEEDEQEGGIPEEISSDSFNPSTIPSIVTELATSPHIPQPTEPLPPPRRRFSLNLQAKVPEKPLEEGTVQESETGVEYQNEGLGRSEEEEEESEQIAKYWENKKPSEYETVIL